MTITRRFQIKRNKTEITFQSHNLIEIGDEFRRQIQTLTVGETLMIWDRQRKYAIRDVIAEKAGDIEPGVYGDLLRKLADELPE